ncbi:hypothetical protein SY88_20595 [Clostridiales bacterium PH28_bin88]|nr:hypothetical protein SY88_20595 [Clostridiales bacterium PH28_bin88]
MIKISERLATIARRVLPGGTMADIGTDHAYLPVYLVEQNKCPRAIASDIHEGPYLTARELVHLYRMEDRISVRCGDGLRVLVPGEADTLVIAGIGGSTIIKILEASPDVATSAKRLVLQPMEDIFRLRAWLVTQGWRLVDEDLVMEGDRYYVILVAEPGRSPSLGEMELEVGPVLMAGRHPLLYGYLDRLVKELKRVIRELTKSSREESREKKEALQGKVKELEKVMAWLSSASE